MISQMDPDSTSCPAMPVMRTKPDTHPQADAHTHTHTHTHARTQTQIKRKEELARLFIKSLRSLGGRVQ